MPIGIFLFAQKFDFQKIEKNVKNEDSFALPLTSELDALCGENVHRFPRLFTSESRFKARPTSPKQKTDHEGRFSFLDVLTKKMPIIYSSFYQVQNSYMGICTKYRDAIAMKQNRIRRP